MPQSVAYKCILAVLALSSLFAISGCSVTAGDFVPQSAFVYPNSNVIDVGPTQASVTHWSFFIFVPEISTQDIKDTYNKALTNVQGSNMLVNYKEDTTVFVMPYIFTTVTYAVAGEAVKQEVGRKDLR